MYMNPSVFDFTLDNINEKYDTNAFYIFNYKYISALYLNRFSPVLHIFSDNNQEKILAFVKEFREDYRFNLKIYNQNLEFFA
jgi:hypothetical protein